MARLHRRAVGSFECRQPIATERGQSVPVPPGVRAKITVDACRGRSESDRGSVMQRNYARYHMNPVASTRPWNGVVAPRSGRAVTRMSSASRCGWATCPGPDAIGPCRCSCTAAAWSVGSGPANRSPTDAGRDRLRWFAPTWDHRRLPTGRAIRWVLRPPLEKSIL